MKFQNPLLKVKGLKKSYEGKPVVDEFSFEVGHGEIVGLLGPNGAGKSTVFLMTIGLIFPEGGQVFFKGAEITFLPIHLRASMGMGYLAQEPSVFRSLSVEDNLLCVLETLPLSKKERQDRLKSLLKELNLTSLAKRRAEQLSGGERRRLEITRTLISDPLLLLLDEPFANVDPIAIADVKAVIRLLRNRGISILITDHNAREIFSIVDRSYLIDQGRVLTSGTVQEILDHREARLSYLGQDFRV